MDKYVVTAVALDKSIAFGGVEPLNNTFFSHYCSPNTLRPPSLDRAPKMK
jgi:hypothetical protein